MQDATELDVSTLSQDIKELISSVELTGMDKQRAICINRVIQEQLNDLKQLMRKKRYEVAFME